MVFREAGRGMAWIAAHKDIFILAALRPVHNLTRPHNRKRMIDRADQQHFIDPIQNVRIHRLVEISLLEKLSGIHLVALEKRSPCELHHQREHYLWVLYD